MRLEDSKICGLVGVAGNIGAKEESIFKRLLEIDTIRGPHSTGIMVVDQRGDVDVVKTVGTPWNLYEFKAFDDAMRGSLCVLMGHNRWATKGKINRRNAHPFDHGHIIGAHNGTLRSQQLLIDHKNFEVDSDNIFHSMAKVGVDETIKNTCGAFALTWYDTEQETMNFVRNDERPLWICESQDSRTVFWASERWMLEVTLGLAKVPYKEPFEPKPGVMYSYPIQLTFVPKEFGEIKIRELELHKWPVVHRQQSYSGGVNTYNQGSANDPKKIGPEALIKLEKVEFCVASLELNKSTGVSYLICLPALADCDVELRLYTSDQGLIKSMIESVHMFTGKVRGFTTYGGSSYCTLDPRTIKEIEDTFNDDTDDDDFAVVFGGQLLLAKEYDLAVSCGCGNCKNVPTIEESDELVWLDNTNFICGDCKDLPVVEDFINQAQNTQQNVKH